MVRHFIWNADFYGYLAYLLKIQFFANQMLLTYLYVYLNKIIQPIFWNLCNIK